MRVENGKSRLTFKGPVQPSIMKVREELETVVGDGEVLLRVFEELGLHVWFRYQKYREEFSHEDVIVAVDETPVGVFVEIEGSEQGIADMAAALGRTPADYIVDSYRGAVPAAPRCARAERTRHGVRRQRMSLPGALVLTAGLGTRLRPLTYVRAKAAVPVNGETLARRVVRWLAGQGVRDLVLNLHHLPETIAALRR